LSAIHGETESAEFPSTKRTVRDQFVVHLSRNLHLAILPEIRFKRVQKLEAKGSNIEVDEHANIKEFFKPKRLVTVQPSTTTTLFGWGTSRLGLVLSSILRLS